MNENKLAFAYTAVAYMFVFLFHLYWVYWASHIPMFYWNGQLMINNVDGYFYGSGAQKLLYHMHEYNPRLQDVWRYGTAVITAFLSKFFHISIDTLMLYLPPVVSSLVVVPIILIGKLYKKLEWGFLSALLAGIGWSYYNRTLAGYYDTDMFAAMLPMMILYFLLYSIKNKNLLFTLFAGITAIIYPWAYDQGLSIVYAMGIMAFLYLLLFNSLKDEFTYKFILLFSLALMDINPFVRGVLVIGAFYFLKEKKVELKHLKIASFLSFLIFLITGNVFGIVLHKILAYSTATTTYEGLKFLNVNETVSEAGKIPATIVFNRIIGSGIGIIIAVVGYILLLRKYKEFIIALPLWGIGFFAFIGGLRFTVYAVPIAAMSGVYFFVWLSEYVKNKKLILITGTLFLLIPNITHIIGCCEKNNSKIFKYLNSVYPIKSYPYLVETTFRKPEVAVLNELKHKSNPKDYVITWWDYGYPIWYYANVNTLIDGGKHNEDNFLVSKILLSSNPYLVRNLSLLSIKTYVDTNKTVATQLFFKDKKPVDVSMYLLKVGSKSFKAPKVDREVYLMFPFRMMRIISTISAFSNRNINTGERYKPHIFLKDRISQKGRYVLVGNVVIDLEKRLINNSVPLKSIDIVAYNNQGKLLKKHIPLNKEGLRLIILQNFKEGIILDDYYYNSAFIQMFVFENYDKNLFEPVILNPLMKIYKIKQ